MPQHPKLLIDPQELIRRNNENAAVYRAYREKRRLRRKLGLKSPPFTFPSLSPSPLIADSLTLAAAAQPSSL